MPVTLRLAVAAVNSLVRLCWVEMVFCAMVFVY